MMKCPPFVQWYLHAKGMRDVDKSLFSLPSEKDVCDLSEGLKGCFQDVKVEVVPCPDLSEEPFFLAGKGLGGSPKLVEIATPPADEEEDVFKEKIYHLKKIASLLDLDPIFLLGAASGPISYPELVCGEQIFNLTIDDGKVKHLSRFATTEPENQEKHLQKKFSKTETGSSFWASLFACQGKPGKVFKIHARGRLLPENFPDSIRSILVEKYQSVVVLGGVFLVKEGEACQQVMRSFRQVSDDNREEVGFELKNFTMSAPLIAVGVLVNSDCANLRVQTSHFHSFSFHGEGGHYLKDVTPETVEYLAYFNTVEEICRVDGPLVPKI